MTIWNRSSRADLNFQSDVYDWLVVAGARAQFKGTGTINGEGNFGFMLTAIDGEQPGKRGQSTLSPILASLKKRCQSRLSPLVGGLLDTKGREKNRSSVDEFDVCFDGGCGHPSVSGQQSRLQHLSQGHVDSVVGSQVFS